MMEILSNGLERETIKQYQYHQKVKYQRRTWYKNMQQNASITLYEKNLSTISDLQVQQGASVTSIQPFNLQ